MDEPHQIAAERIRNCASVLQGTAQRYLATNTVDVSNAELLALEHAADLVEQAIEQIDATFYRGSED